MPPQESQYILSLCTARQWNVKQEHTPVVHPETIEAMQLYTLPISAHQRSILEPQATGSANDQADDQEKQSTHLGLYL